MRMNNFKRTLLVLAIVAFTFAAAGCKHTKLIPNEKLTEIFKDMFLLNAYMDRSRFIVSLDSVDVYKPILDKYGYTEADFKYTLTESMKRKSFRLSDIMDNVIASLETDYAGVDQRIKRQEYIDSLAYAFSEEEFYNKPEILIRKAADTLPLEIKIKKDKRDGRFTFSYYYKLDSADYVQGIVNRHEIIDAKGKVLGNTVLRPYPGKHVKYETSMTGSPEASKIRLKFGIYPKDSKKINLTIDSLIIRYQPPKEQAMKALVERYAGYKLMMGDKEYDEYITMPTDSGALDILPPLAPKGTDSLGGR